SGSGVKIAEGMKKTAPDGAVSGMPAIRETGPGKNLQAITVSTKRTTRRSDKAFTPHPTVHTNP
ncbi:hypothetical protein, partial [Escherichia coli]|uniref:hypothetical protein n=4 Tax=Escherichia coli TaxID=562 RepID=UPI000BE19377